MVRSVIEAVSLHSNRQELFTRYSALEPEDIRHAILYAAANIAGLSISIIARA